MAFALSGCWDLVEVDRRTFATTIGIDSDQQGNVSLSVQLPLPEHMLSSSASSTSGQSPNKEFSTSRITAKTANEALDILQTRTYRELVIEQNKSIVISESAAKRGIKPLIDFFIRNPKAPPQSLIFVAHHHTAEEVLSMMPVQEILPGLQFISSAQSPVKSDRTYFISVGQFETKAIHTATDAYAPLIDLEQKEGMYEVAGLAVFDGFHLAGELNMEETQMFGLLSSQMDAGQLTLSLPEQGILSLRNVNARSSIKVRIAKDGSPFFIAKVQFHSTLSELEKEHKDVSPQVIRRLELAMQRVLTPKISRVIRKLQSYNSDIIDFGEEYRVQHFESWKKRSWKQTFPEARFKVIVHAKIERDGILR